MTGEVVVLEPGDEQAQKIAKAMSSPTANDILAILAAGTRSLSDITEQLNIPLTTVKYHVENLLDAGLIKISETRYSIKGREVKMYALTDRLLIVAPKRTNVRDLLLKYSSLFGFVIAGTLAIIGLSPLLSLQEAPAAAPRMMAAGMATEGGMNAAKAVSDNTAAIPAAGALDPAVAFFLGGVLVIIVLLCYEAWLWKKRR
ncbi:helix-turn-helix domain-containing protein [Methanoregula sp.]|uniref:ArsR/SmtB family transcription factor n=1 Tax=Methanoregula sp. TaxID=2052170 RepID=UPI002C532C76|nr:helix-turn-helix domain-containing protein [Methanoregula sp.]HVP96049.1 helix-turn-helix domain-containing protein [Methanoregula sp.]